MMLTHGRLVLVFVLTALAAVALAAPQKVSEISLERTPCFGTCPVDRVVLRPDGTAQYEGKRFVPRVGAYTGAFSRERFAKLARLLDERAFWKLKPRYEVRATDLPTHITSAVRGGKRVQVEDYGHAGPDGLHAVEEAILREAASVRWKPVKKEAPVKEPAVQASGVRGKAVLGPVAPVERPGQADTRPMAGAVILVETPDGKEAARTTTGAQGEFKIPLAPGKYRLVPRPPDPRAFLPRAFPVEVVVKERAFTEITVRYDSGIR